MAEGLTLIGFEHSVYTRIVRMALSEMSLTAGYIETDPFAEPRDPILTAVTPFGRVPVLQHGKFVLGETAAILSYLDQINNDATFVPEDPCASAQMAQVIGIVDAYGYRCMVRDVFSHGWYRPHFELEWDAQRLKSGMSAAQPVLKALDRIAKDGRILSRQRLSLADFHLAPMMAYFVMVPVAAQRLADFPDLLEWWGNIKNRYSLRATDPFTTG